MINKLQLRPLRGSEYIQFLLDTLDIIKRNNPEALMIKVQYEILQSKLDEIEEAFKVKRASEITKEIEGLDVLRSKALNGIKLMIHSLTYSSNIALGSHAKILEAHLGLFGSSVAKENYQSKTTILRNVINDWQTKPELMEAITALQLTAWQTELEQANNEFVGAYIRRNQELIRAIPLQNLKTLRLEANEAYYKLRDRLDAFWEINEGTEPWASTINQINQQISNYVTLLKRRSAGGSTEQHELASE